jgi:hypothetical protein
MPANDTAIINLAVQLLGEDLIIEPQQQVKAAVQAAAALPYIRDEVLTSYVWRCLLRRAVLAPLAQKPAFGFNYQYTKPTNLARLYSLNDDVYAAYELEGDNILTDLGPVLNARYTVLETDSSKYEPHLVTAMAARLAAQICMPITQNEARENSLWGQYKRLAEMGAMISARQSNNNYFPSSSWVDGRL